MNDLTNIQPGDLIAVKNDARNWGNLPTISHRLYRVTRLTATQAEAVNVHASHQTIWVRLSDGKLIGKDYTKATVATPEIVAQHNAETRIIKRHAAAVQKIKDLEGKHLHQLKLSVPQLEALAEAWERVKSMGPEAV